MKNESNNILSEQKPTPPISLVMKLTKSKTLSPSLSGQVINSQGGLRVKGIYKKTCPNKPLISVITVVYNADQLLDVTIQSVINQRYDNLEFIIIDGGSTDGTLDIIKRYETQIDYWLSEPDAGIYDAMNKGVIISSGDWVVFINSGDYFYSTDVISNIFTNNYAKFDLIYGDSIKTFANFERYQKAGDLSSIWKSTIFWHQCLFTKRQLLINHPFDLNFKLCADYDFTLKMVSIGRLFHNIKFPICYVSSGGLSDINRISSLMERRDIIRRYKNTLTIKIYYMYELAYVFIAGLAKKILPMFFVNYIIRNKTTHS